jgi:hypothetical protein
MSENTYRLSVSRDNFSKLLLLLKTFENYCTDCDVKNGLFRCRSNDRQAIISMDLTSILANNDLSFSLIKSKVALLKTFELDDNIQIEDKTIVIESNESNYEICDPFSKLIFRKPVQRYIDNQFIDNDQFSEIIQLSEDNLLFSYDINNYIKRRISNIALGFQTDVVECNIADVSAILKIATSNKEDSANLASGIVVNRSVGNKSFKMISMPFVLDISADLKINCYTTNHSDVYMCKFDQSFYGVTISIYTQVKVSNM